MLVHLRTQQQISDNWPVLRELIREHFVDEVALCPSYTNNILTHALLNLENFQLCLHFTEKDLQVPTSFTILDMGFDKLIEKKVCTVVLWVATKQMNKREIQQYGKDLIAWVKGCGCAIIKAQGLSQKLMESEVGVLSGLGLLKKHQMFHGWHSII